MAGHSGGSWKVAYADFVTAMMAFFLVMWIGAQDTKTRQSVANYFVDPSGVSKKPVQSGAVLDTPTYGNTPKRDAPDMGTGRDPHDQVPGAPSPPTKVVSDWLHDDPKRVQMWQARAQKAKEAAVRSREVVENRLTVKEVATQDLSKQIRAEFTASAATIPSGVFQNLLYGTIDEVNWTQLAQDLLR